MDYGLEEAGLINRQVERDLTGRLREPWNRCALKIEPFAVDGRDVEDWYCTVPCTRDQN